MTLNTRATSAGPSTHYKGKLRQAFQCCLRLVKPKKSAKLQPSAEMFTYESNRYKEKTPRKTATTAKTIEFLSKRDSKKKLVVLELEQLLVCRPLKHHSRPETEVWLRADWALFYEEVSKIYDIIIWSLLPKEKAIDLISLVDPYKLIKLKLYKNDCTIKRLSSGGEFLVKSLETLGADPKTTIFLDVGSYKAGESTVGI